MRCADPVLCYTNTKGGRAFRNFSLSNQVFVHLHQQVFSCGKCIICRKKRAYELASRCVLHASLYKQNCFLTLTYDEKKTGYHNNLNYKDIQDFKKRLRSYCKRKFDKKVELFNVHEYGKNGKKHWHLICFNHDFSEDKTVYTYKNAVPLHISKSLETLWPHGFSTIGDVNEASAMYQAQYMEKDFKHGYVKSNKASHSKHSGLGKPYFLLHYSQLLSLGYVPMGGRKMPIPRYFLKIAHKHHSHFYEPGNFLDTKQRKALYRPFNFKTPDQHPNKEIADLFRTYKADKDKKIIELQKEWDEVILQYLTTKEKPDFIKSAENTLHDLRNRTNQEEF